MLTYLDISEQRRALDTIALAEQRQRRLLELAPFPLAVTRLSDGQILYTNARTAEAVGLQAEEIRGTFALDFYANPGRPQASSEILPGTAGSGTWKCCCSGRGGRQFWALVNASFADYEATPALLFGVQRHLRN